MTATTARTWGIQGWDLDSALHQEARIAAQLRAHEGTLQQVWHQLDAVTRSQHELINIATGSSRDALDENFQRICAIKAQLDEVTRELDDLAREHPYIEP